MTAEWEAVDITDEDDIAETITRRDYEDSISFFRGLMWGLALVAIPFVLVGVAVAVWIGFTR